MSEVVSLPEPVPIDPVPVPNLVNDPVPVVPVLIDPVLSSLSIITVLESSITFASDIKKYIELHKNEFSPQILSIVTSIIENKSFLENVEKLFQKIVDDKKINALDIPLLVILLQEMFVLFQNSSFTFQDYTAVLKMLILILVSKNIDGKLNPSEQVLIMNTIDAVLECCIQLVEWKEKNPSIGKSKFCCF
jgi:hypothetical protein